MKLIQFIRFVKTIIRIIFGRGAVWLLFPTLASCQIGFFSAGAPKLLDEYPGASAAYSVHELSNSATLAMQVRRASDNATADIGFDNGELNIGQLINHCSGTNCFVSIWYDQSGNGRNATQTTAGNQPKIYDSSTGINKINNAPSLYFDGTNDFFDVSDFGISGNNARSIFSSVNFLKATGFLFSISNDSGLSDFASYNLTCETGIRISGGNELYSGTSAGNDYLLTNIFPGGNITASKMFANGSELTAASSVSGVPVTSNTFNKIGKQAIVSGLEYQGKIQFLVFYATDQTANRTGIETNLNNFFSIY